MRFFTFEWWSGWGKVPDTAVADYWTYIDSVRSALPVAVLEFCEKHTLHDARVQSLVIDNVANTARLAALGWALGLDARRQYRLVYSGLRSVEVLGDREEPLGGPGGLGDLGYDEWLSLPGGMLEHRLLFSTGVEIALVHASFSFEAEPLLSPDT